MSKTKAKSKYANKAKPLSEVPARRPVARRGTQEVGAMTTVGELVKGSRFELFTKTEAGGFYEPVTVRGIANDPKAKGTKALLVFGDHGSDRTVKLGALHRVRLAR